MRIHGEPRRALIDLRDVAAVRARRPLLIAHRGGVIAPGAPENTLAAMRSAALHGYDMVELDVSVPADDEPVLFHDPAGTLLRHCGVDARLGERTARELTAIHYLASAERIATLAEGLALCHQLRLGVMLDIKTPVGADLTPAFVRRIAALLVDHALTSAAMTISPFPLVRDELAGRVLFPVTEDECRRSCGGEPTDLGGKFWFGLPAQLRETAIPALQRAGALVIPAINTHRYPPHAHAALARDDIDRLRAAGADGFQIDSIYGGAFGRGYERVG